MKKTGIITVLLALCAAWGPAFADEAGLIRAVKSGNLKNVTKLIEAGDSPDTYDSTGKSIAMISASSGKFNITDYLLSKNINTGKTDKNGITLLHILAGSRSRGALPLIEKVIGMSGDINRASGNRETPVSVAIKTGNIEALTLFIDKGGLSVNAQEYNMPMIIYAYTVNQVKIVKLLADKGARLNAADNAGNTIIHLAIRKNDSATVKLLAEKGAGLDLKNSTGQTPLLMAADKGRYSLMQYLIEKKADISAADGFGKNILHLLAAEKNTGRIIESVKAPAEVLNKNDNEGKTPLALAVASRRWENVKPLINIGAEQKYIDPAGRTLLMLAIDGKSSDPASYMIDKGADVRARDNTGISALQMTAALKGKNWDALLLKIIQAGGDVNSGDNSGITPAGAAIDAANTSAFKILAGNGLNLNSFERKSDPLILYAYKKNRRDIVNDLTQRGASLSGKDAAGNTILHITAEKNDIQFYKSLGTLNFDINVKNTAGKTPLLSAIEKGSFQFAQMLISDKEKTDLKVRDSKGMSAVHYLASMKGGDKLLGMIDVQASQVNETDLTGRSPLCIAVSSGYVANAGVLLEKGADARGKDQNGQDLIIPAYLKSREMMNLLLQKGADPNASDFEGKSLVYHSIEKKDPETLKLLIQRNVDINKKYNSGTYPLIHSINKGYSPVINILIDSGADKNARDDSGVTPLSAAVEKGDASTSGYLVKAGADVSVKNRSGKGLIFVAYDKNRPDIFGTLVSGGARTDETQDGSTVLHLAASGNRLSFINILVKGNVNLNALNNDQKTAVILASEKGYSASVRALITAGADLKIKDKTGETALFKAVRADSDGYGCAEALIKGGAQINDKNSSGMPILHEAAAGAKFRIVDLLLKNSADANILNQKGETLMLVLSKTPYSSKKDDAKAKQAAKLVEQLAGLGSDANIPDKYGRTPLDLSCKTKNMTVIEALLKAGAKVDALDSSGNTALKKIVMDYIGDYRISDKDKKAVTALIDLLIKNGANINAKDKYGRTALSHIMKEANQRNMQKIIDITPVLVARGAQSGIRDNEGKSAADYAEASNINEIKTLVR